MKRNLHLPLERNSRAYSSIPNLLMTRGFDATLSFFCTVFIFSLD